MSYRQLLANLEALPEGERQLAAGVYHVFEDGKRICGCVLGKGIPALLRVADEDTYRRISTIVNVDEVLTEAELEGLTLKEAGFAQGANDRFGSLILTGVAFTPAEVQADRRARYAHMIEWLRARVSEESEAPQAL